MLAPILESYYDFPLTLVIRVPVQVRRNDVIRLENSVGQLFVNAEQRGAHLKTSDHCHHRKHPTFFLCKGGDQFDVVFQNFG